jgi:hypothetical protein
MGYHETPLPPYTPRKGWVGPGVGLEAVEKSKTLYCRESNLGRPACSPSLYWLSDPDS